MDSEAFIASLGELGAPGPDGFSRRTSSRPTRQITITDGEGQTVYSARTADTPEAADGHVKVGGFRRVTDWSNGVCSVERIPATEKRRKKLIIAASCIGAVIAVAAGCSTLASVKQPAPSPTATYVPPFTASGSLTIESLSINRDLHNVFDKSNDNCNPTGGYKDLAIDSEVEITGNGGSLVGTGRVKNGKQSATPKNCVLTWEVAEVPAGEYIYTIQFGHRPPVEVSEDELRAGYEATIGSGK
ncbi:hypothetical protein [Arthrobacter sp. OV608]|uniref:hypothetical protein n=1 Tax=Arthrobacter sp. OV608 TaxID=1882768 RepID=UPI0008BFE297|nr:hypothetical protein [Arthrobacter sp. OV608]SER23086.1 hypothetical protein SAMN05444745_1258 [Arthrobacter sp. OV608]